MSAALKAPMSLAAFLDWERLQEMRYEFDGCHAVAMNGGTRGHWAIQRNLMGMLISGLRGHRCQPCGSGMRVRTATGIRYPDAFVVCSPVMADAEVVTDPVIVFEILSPSTASVDHIDKNQEYRNTASIQRYVIVEQTTMAATVFRREGDDWVGHLQIGDTVLGLPEIGLTLPLMEAYEGVVFHARDGVADGSQELPG
jgi:Uma2 family endonuclease